MTTHSCSFALTVGLPRATQRATPARLPRATRPGAEFVHLKAEKDDC